MTLEPLFNSPLAIQIHVLAVVPAAILGAYLLARPKGTQHALANAIAAAYFLEHRQVNEPEVLAEIATGHGFTHEEALGDIADPRELEVSHELAISAAQQGIQGVPFFVFEGRFAMSGAQPEEVFEMAFKRALEEAA